MKSATSDPNRPCGRFGGAPSRSAPIRACGLWFACLLAACSSDAPKPSLDTGITTPPAGSSGAGGLAGAPDVPKAGQAAAGSGGTPPPVAGSAAGSGGASAGSGAGPAGSGGMGASGSGGTSGAAAPDAGPPSESECVRSGEDTDRPVLEALSRGVIAVAIEGGVFVGFRLLATDAPDTAFHVYRGTTRVTEQPLAGATQFVDRPGDPNARYSVAAVVQGTELARSGEAAVLRQNYLTVPLQTQSGYVPNDASVGDLDGDGEYELVLKQEQTPRDNSQAGATGETLLEAYELDGTLSWRINLGRNIREGAHYTQFIVYDLDGDGRAEVACKTADGTRDGTGKVIGNASANHRNGDGYVLSGPEFLTVFDGRTGAAITTVDYLPPRGRVSDWGDDYGNRVDRFLAAVAYLDGQRPSLIMTRGYYTRSVLAAWDFRDGELTRRWVFDTDASGQQAYAGQGNHNLSVADIDDDGRQEIVFGGMAVDDDGTGMWTTGLGHGDALHVSEMDESNPGLEIWRIQERVDAEGGHLLSAATGRLMFAKPSRGEEGPGRGVGADILASNPGYELWAAGGELPAQLWNSRGENVGRAPSSCNFVVFWDGDAQHELLDGNRIDKYGPSGETRLMTADGCSSNNGTKSTPALSADLFGDFREEVVFRTDDNRALRIFTTTIPTDLRVATLMHDPQYRVAVAWQNVGYNQPPHPSFLLSSSRAAPWPEVQVACRP